MLLRDAVNGAPGTGEAVGTRWFVFPCAMGPLRAGTSCPGPRAAASCAVSMSFAAAKSSDIFISP